MSLFFNRNILINIDILELEDFNCESDVGFLIDGSHSICGTGNGCLDWIHTMNFLLILANYMGIAERGTHVSVALFSAYDRRIMFNDFWDIDGLLGAVSNIAYPNGHTATTLALSMALTGTDLDGVGTGDTAMFQPINGMRDGVPQTLVFLTDGQCGGANCEEIDFLGLRTTFEDREIQVIGIGAGANVDMGEIGWLTDQAFRAQRFDLLYDRQFALDLDLCQGSYK